MSLCLIKSLKRQDPLTPGVSVFSYTKNTKIQELNTLTAGVNGSCLKTVESKLCRLYEFMKFLSKILVIQIVKLHLQFIKIISR